MVIDTSAIAAILFRESDASELNRRVAEDPVRLVSAATWVEATIVVETRLGDSGGFDLDLWLKTVGATVVPMDEDQAQEARRAWRRFGKGRHPAALNYGDCLVYGLAMTRSESLLFKGGGFAKTDVRAA